MKVLTLNCGSSSVKYSIVEMPSTVQLCHGIVERVTQDDSFVRHRKAGEEETVRRHECPTHDVAVQLATELVTDSQTGVIRSPSEIDAVGHRVVHGGEKYAQSVIIDGEVVRDIESYAVLAPLHNPANLAGVRGALKSLPRVPHVAVFDTAFFATLPPYVFIYGIPYEWYEQLHVRKYGFHGSSHYWVSRRAAALLGKRPEEANLITIHMGNGVSLTAIKDGKACDHSMGFTPLEGAVMGTRCGDVDPAIPLYVMKKKSLSAESIGDILNRKSGLLGITGKYIDRREILAAIERGEDRARLAFEIECYRLRKYIGAYMAVLGRVDAIVFTAGAGENSHLHRLKTCEGLEPLGVEIDLDRNKAAVAGRDDVEISKPGSRVKLFVIPTNEELVLAEEAYAVCAN